IVAGVRDHDVAGSGKVPLDLPRQTAGHGGEHELRPAPRHTLLDDPLRRLRGRPPLELPGGHLPVRLPRTAVARRQPLRLEPRMILQKLKEPLPHRARGSQDADLDLLVHALSTPQPDVDALARHGGATVYRSPGRAAIFSSSSLDPSRFGYYPSQY